MKQLIVIAHNLRSTHNVGSLFRTAEGLGVSKLYLTGYTPYPSQLHDDRLPHISQKLSKQINKTALGAELHVPWEHDESIASVIARLKAANITVAAIEQAEHSVPLSEFRTQGNIAIILGREVEGIESEVLELCDIILEIPMDGKKESFNVAAAAAMALYQLRFHS